MLYLHYLVSHLLHLHLSYDARYWLSCGGYADNHEKTHREDCKLKCDQCDYTTTQKYYLAQHITARHTGDKPFLCDTCGSGFAVRTQLEQHRRFGKLPRGVKIGVDMC
jgi:hypothetical protein